MDDRSGFGLTSIIIAVVALAAIMVPTTKWIVSMSNDTEELGTKLEMQSYIQDYWQRVNAATYDEFQEEIATKGTTWTEDVGGKYELTIKFSADGKYQNAQCHVGTAAGTEDRHCRKAEITIVSKENTSLAKGLETTKISTAAESQKMKEMENKIAANTNSISNMSNSISSMSSRISSYSSSISSLNSSYSSLSNKFSDCYTKSEVDAKVSSAGGSSGYTGYICTKNYGSICCQGQWGACGSNNCAGGLQYTRCSKEYCQYYCVNNVCTLKDSWYNYD